MPASPPGIGRPLHGRWEVGTDQTKRHESPAERMIRLAPLHLEPRPAPAGGRWRQRAGPASPPDPRGAAPRRRPARVARRCAGPGRPRGRCASRPRRGRRSRPVAGPPTRSVRWLVQVAGEDDGTAQATGHFDGTAHLVTSPVGVQAQVAGDDPDEPAVHVQLGSDDAAARRGQRLGQDFGVHGLHPDVARRAACSTRRNVPPRRTAGASGGPGDGSPGARAAAASGSRSRGARRAPPVAPPRAAAGHAGRRAGCCRSSPAVGSRRRRRLEVDPRAVAGPLATPAGPATPPSRGVPTTARRRARRCARRSPASRAPPSGAEELLDVADRVGVEHTVDDRVTAGTAPLDPGADAVLDEHRCSPAEGAASRGASPVGTASGSSTARGAATASTAR